MRILWVRQNALDPARGGGHIRTFNVVRQLSRRHSIDLLSFADGVGGEVAPPDLPSVRAIGVPLPTPDFRPGSAGLPRLVARCASNTMRELIGDIESHYDQVVVDFLHIAPNVPHLERAILFQHNVETSLQFRQVRYRRGRRDQLALLIDTARFYRYERRVCRAVRHVWAVSGDDQALMKRMFGVTAVTNIGTGVDVPSFDRPAELPRDVDIIFVGSMNWAPNIDGMVFFLSEVLPLIRRRVPGCSVAIVGRDPDRSVLELARTDPAVTVTGTVPDVRPHFWGARLSVVPLRVGGGTRIKIYEAMAARCPVVSTAVGCEGLGLTAGTHLLMADDPAGFAAHCIHLLENAGSAAKLSEAARAFVAAERTWEQVAARCERGLDGARSSRSAGSNHEASSE